MTFLPKLPSWSRRVSEEHVISVRFAASAQYAGIVQWQYTWLPIRLQGFDSPYPLKQPQFGLGNLTEIRENVNIISTMKKAVFVGAYFIVTLLFLLSSIYYFAFLSFKTKGALAIDNSMVAYAALPELQNGFKDKVIAKDARAELLASYFRKYNSELTPFAQNIVDAADQYQIDYRLVPAIAMQESNLCKVVPDNSYNCWGFGIYGDQVKHFPNYESAIETVTKTLASDYKSEGLITPEQIMKKYTPGSHGSWASGVSEFMAQISSQSLEAKQLGL